MYKFPIPIAHDVAPPSRWRRLRRSAAIAVLGLAIAPLVYEALAMCHAQWCQVLGRNAQARTPVFDSLSDGVSTGHRSFWDTIGPYFQHVPWNPKIVFAVAAVVMVLAMTMLKM